MAQQIQLRRDTAANWTSVNPILAEGEIGIELNSGQYKIGDGVSHWNSITYAGLIPGLTATAPITYNSGTKTIGWSGSKSDVGLGNVDNTSDANKPVSTAQAAADAAVQAFAIQRANHTGTQTASTISDFDSAADARASALIAALNSGNLPHTPAADGWFTAAISTIKAALDSLAKGRALHPVVLPESITVPTGFVLIRENTEIPSGLDITLEGTATLRII